MRYRITALLLPALASTALAATSTTVNWTATLTSGPFSGTSSSLTFTGNTTMSPLGSGTMSATVSLSSIGSTTIPIPYTVTFSGGGTLGGILSLPASALESGGALTGSGTVTGGTGAYGGDTGNFPSLNGTSSGSLSTGLTITFSGSGTVTVGGTPAPTITQVLDAGSYSANLAPGSVFVVKGTNLSPAGIGVNGVVSTSYPLPPSSNGVSINFTPASGGTATQVYIVYLYNSGGVNQLAGILPSTVTPGNYNVTVANGTQTSSAASVKVVANKPGLVTRDSSGSGLAVIQNYNTSTAAYDIDSFTTGSVGGATISPAHPGQILIAWLTGMGAAPFADNTAPNGGQGYDFTKNGVAVEAYVGGVSIPVAFGGRTGCCAGEDEIVFTLPSTVTPDCTVPFQVSVNGVLSQTTFISIAPAGAAACVSPIYTSSQLQAFDNGTTAYSGSFSLSTENSTESTLGNVTIYSASGSFTSTSGFELPYSGPNPGSITPGTCIVTQILPNLSSTVTTTNTNLDAGQVTLTGPSGSSLSGTAFTKTSNAYSLNIGQQGLPSQAAGQYGSGSIVPGTYTLKGSGGNDVGPFSATVTLGPAFVIAGGLPTTITRSAGLTLNWTGGNSTDSVVIYGLSEMGTSPNVTGAAFECFTTAGAGTFTVPASILTQLPAVSAAAITNMSGLGSIAVISGVQPSSGNGLFSAPLTAGGSISSATFLGTTEDFGEAAFQ